MKTRYSVSSTVFALAFAIFGSRPAQASPDLFPPEDRLIKMDCAGGKCKIIPRGNLPPFIADLLRSEGLPYTPEVLGIFNLRAMKVACDRADASRLILHPRLNGFATKAELEVLAQRMGCVRLAYAFNGEQDVLLPTELPPCQRSRGACEEYVGGLETRLAAVDSCATDELFNSRTGQCVKGADEQFVQGLQAAVAQEGRRYMVLRNAIADCESGRVTLDQQGNPVCNSLPKAAGIVWPLSLIHI